MSVEELVEDTSPEEQEYYERAPIIQSVRNLIGDGLKSLDTSKIACVYFLCWGGKVYYIGQTKDLVRRLMAHREKGEFDEILYFEVDDDRQRCELEESLISSLRPPLNKKISRQQQR